MNYRINILCGVSNLPLRPPIYFGRLEEAIAAAMAVNKTNKVTVQSWDGTKGCWVSQMERTRETEPLSWQGKMIPPCLRFISNDSKCTDCPPLEPEPYDGVPADTGSV
jgi:hypothetical protein